MVPPLTVAVDYSPRRPQRKLTSHRNKTTKAVEVSKSRVAIGVKEKRQ